MKKVVTREAVQAAIIRLLQEGKTASVENIRVITGGGNKLIKEYRDECLAGCVVDEPVTQSDLTETSDLVIEIRALVEAVHQLISVLSTQQNNQRIISKQSEDNSTSITSPSVHADNIKTVRRQSTYSPEIVALANKLLLEGVSASEVSRQTGIPATTLRTRRAKLLKSK